MTFNENNQIVNTDGENVGVDPVVECGVGAPVDVGSASAGAGYDSALATSSFGAKDDFRGVAGTYIAKAVT